MVLEIQPEMLKALDTAGLCWLDHFISVGQNWRTGFASRLCIGFVDFSVSCEGSESIY